jgi:predicted metal-dependent HD superfamily phosphohydrolase
MPDGGRNRGADGGAVRHPPAADREVCLRSFEDLLVALPLSAGWRAELAMRYAEPWRAYHDAAHPGLLWHRHLAAQGSTEDIELGLAIAFHDAVFQPGAPDNEARSAALLLRAVPGASRAAAAVRATRDHGGYDGDDPLVARLLDLDLTPLAEPPLTFRANSQRLRAELPSLPEAEFLERVRTHLGHLRRAGPVYRTALGKPFEAAAQANIGALLDGGVLNRTG